MKEEYYTIDKYSKRKIIAYGENLMGVHMRFIKMPDVPIKTHQHMHEQFTMITKGDFIFNIDGVITRLSEGDTIFFESNIKHGCKCLSDIGELTDTFSPIRKDYI